MFDVTRFPLPMLPTNAAALTRRRMVRMWTNFATFGDPTPVTDSLIPVRWSRYTLANEEYMDITNGLAVKSAPYDGRLHPWHAFQDRFNPSYPG